MQKASGTLQGYSGCCSLHSAALRHLWHVGLQEATTLLKAPQAVAATGQVLLHRFYSKHSLVEVDVKVSCMARRLLCM